jgi:preflagellin peptidase FlaK
VQDIDPRVLWPLEYIDEDGHHVKRLTPRGVPLDAFDPKALAARGIDRVWVTPKVPFLVPLFAGFVVAVLVGDPLAVALDAAMGAP